MIALTMYILEDLIEIRYDIYRFDCYQFGNGVQLKHLSCEMKCHIEDEYCETLFPELNRNIHLIWFLINSSAISFQEQCSHFKNLPTGEVTEGIEIRLMVNVLILLVSLFETFGSSLYGYHSYFSHCWAKITFRNHRQEGEVLLAPGLRWETVHHDRKCGSGGTSCSHFVSSHDGSRETADMGVQLVFSCVPF